jgi:DNA-binding FadR family transcriptional regulator
MPYDLQSDILDRALPDALRTLLVLQTEALEALLQYAQGTKETIRGNEHVSLGKTTQIDPLATEVNKRLSALEDQQRQIWAQLETFQQLLRRQGNPILTHTVERVKEILERNLTMAKQGLDAIIHGQSP